jgi:predicted ribosomally synthesized peptide with SipW-like signal peptide
MKMKKKVTNFVLDILHMKFHPLFRTNEGGRIIRNSRIMKFRKKNKKLVIAAQLVAIWYLLVVTVSYLTTNTGAYFNDIEQISETITAAEDFCQEFKTDKEKNSDYYKTFCKDNAGLGNGKEPFDPGTGGKGTDPDNPGHNKGGCDDHTNAPCSEVNQIRETHTDNSITLSWSNPSNESFNFVKIYKNDNPTPVGENLREGLFIDESLLPSTKYSYKITTVDSSGNESSGVTIDVTTSNDLSDNYFPKNVTSLIGSRNGKSDNISLSWKNPTGISHVRIYNEGNSNLVADNVKGENIKLTSNGEITFRITTVDMIGIESTGEKVTVK